MPHDTALIATLAASFGLAFAFGFVASRLRLPPIVGYLLAGVAVGPYSPGFVADQGLAAQLAEVGVMLLMFGVGLHFSVGDLLAARRLAAPGAVLQLAATTTLGAVLARLAWGWPWLGGVTFGLSLGVASTVVLLRTLEDRGRLDAAEGRLAVSWVVVEDLVTVLALVLLPALATAQGAGGGEAPTGAAVARLVVRTLLSVGGFVAVMWVVGRRAIPWLLERVARQGSRELFTLGVLTVALGIAVGAAILFHVSFALGAFLAGVVIGESELSHQAAAEALPLQDAFAVLFFVSAGMLVDPRIFVTRPLALLAVVAVVLCWKPLVTAGVARLLGAPSRVALPLGGALAQIGEFSFVLSGLGVSLGLIPAADRPLLLAAALVAITLNPLVARTLATLGDRAARHEYAREQAREEAREQARVDGREPPASDAPLPGAPGLAGHAVLVGFGRVGATVGAALATLGIPVVVAERDRRAGDAARALGLRVVFGDAARPGVLAATGVGRAGLLVVAAPEAFHAREIVRTARAACPDLPIIVRTHGAAEQQHLARLGVRRAMLGERELAYAMAHEAVMALGRSDAVADALVATLRSADAAPQGARPAADGG